MANLPSLRDRSIEVLHDLYHGDNPLLRVAAAGASDALNTPLSGLGGQSRMPAAKHPRWRKLFGFAAPHQADPLMGRAEAKAGSRGKQHLPVAVGSIVVPARSSGAKSTDGYQDARAFAQDGLSREEMKLELDSRAQSTRPADQAQPGIADGNANFATPSYKGNNPPTSR